MGSSLSHTAWLWIAAVSGVLFLIFDASRYFTHQISPVTLRRWSGDPDQEERSRWFEYDPLNLRLLNGALLQTALVIALLATVKVFDSAKIAAAIWLAVILVWKFGLGFVPEDLAEFLLRLLFPVSRFFYYLFWPVLFPLRAVAERLERDDHDGEEQEAATEEEVQAFIDVGEDEGILEASEGKMIHSVVEFGDRVARELMTPRIDVLAFDATRPLRELAQLFNESKYSRIPIYHETIDRITGIVHVKDAFEVVFRNETKSVGDLARSPFFVSETKKVTELLREFQSEHLQLAVVVDEYGGTAGLITIEDVIEEIVGEIADEHEEEEATIVDLGNGEYLVSGQLRIDALDEMLDAHFAGEDYETVAGLIFTNLGRIPKTGATVRKNGYIFTVDRADKRRIYRVRVSRDPEWNAEDATIE
jgi:CBS domain containing-hemolysin-like protein